MTGRTGNGADLCDEKAIIRKCPNWAFEDTDMPDWLKEERERNGF